MEIKVDKDDGKGNSTAKNAAIAAFGDRTPNLIAELEKIINKFKL